MKRKKKKKFVYINYLIKRIEDKFSKKKIKKERTI